MSEIKTTRAQRRELARVNAKQPAALREVAPETFSHNPFVPDGLIRVLRSRDFLVQVFNAPAPTKVRLSVCRTVRLATDEWQDGITWDDLQRLKREAGYGADDAVEIFPRDSDVVNVANMRHLWIIDGAIPFAWRDGE